MTTTADYDPVVARAPSDEPFEDEGLEEELEPSEEVADDEISQPFDPNSIRIRSYNLSVDTMLNRIHAGDTDLQPSFQRRLGIWTQEKKSRLVESLLLRIPIPVFYAAADGLDNWSVVDGIQRLSALDGFVQGDFTLRGLQYLRDYHGKSFGELPRHFQRRIAETQLVINVIEHGTPEEVMLNIFLRINTGGTPLSGQEIRHAINPGLARDYLKDLAESDQFREATDWSVNSRRMADRELALRFLAFSIFQVEEYQSGDMDGFLNKAMKHLNTSDSSELERLRDRFTAAMVAARTIFAQEAFRKPRTGTRRRPINRALFEVWAVNLGQLESAHLNRLMDRSPKIQSRFEQLCGEAEFDAAISWATGSPDRVRTRFNRVSAIISEVARC